MQRTADLIRANRMLVLAVAVAAGLLAAVMAMIFPAPYKAETIFSLKSPLYGDRGNLYNNEAKTIVYLATRDELARFMALTSSDSVQEELFRETGLTAHYRLDPNDPETPQRLKTLFEGRVKVFRSEEDNLLLDFTDRDRQMAAKVANALVPVMERYYRSFYVTTREDMAASLEDRIHTQDSLIDLYTDTLSALREQFGINDIISPARYNIMLSTLKSNGKAGFSKGVEQIQNIESIKDELVSARARNITLLGQYATGGHLKDRSLVSMIQRAYPPLRRDGFGWKVWLVLGGLTGMICAVLYLVFRKYLKADAGRAF